MACCAWWTGQVLYESGQSGGDTKQQRYRNSRWRKRTRSLQSDPPIPPSSPFLDPHTLFSTTSDSTNALMYRKSRTHTQAPHLPLPPPLTPSTPPTPSPTHRSSSHREQAAGSGLHHHHLMSFPGGLPLSLHPGSFPFPVTESCGAVVEVCVRVTRIAVACSLRVRCYLLRIILKKPKERSKETAAGGGHCHSVRS